jgi:hypothetical protein
MANLDFIVGTAQDKAAGRAQIIPEDLIRMTWKGAGLKNTTALQPIPKGSYVKVKCLPGVINLPIALDGVDGSITFELLPTTQGGETIFDGKPPGVNSSPAISSTFGGWGGKGGLTFAHCNVIVRKGIIFQNWSENFSTWLPDGTVNGYGNMGGVYKLGAGNLQFEGKIRNCDDGLRLTNDDPGVTLFKGEIDGCGSGTGQEHNIYSHGTAFFGINAKSRNARVGHNAKILDGLCVLWGGDYSDDPGVAKGASYCIDANGGQQYWLGVYFGQSEAEDSNDSVLTSFLTDRMGQGPHHLVVSGCHGVANIAQRGLGIRAKNPARDPQAPDWRTALNLDTHILDGYIGGNLWEYLASKLNYAYNKWVGLPATNCTIKRGVDQLVTIGSPHSPPAINWAEVSKFLIGAELAKLDPDTITLSDCVRLANISENLRKAYVWPPLIPTPPAYVPALLIQPPLPADEDEAVIEEQRVIIAQLTKQIEDDAVANAAALKAQTDRADAAQSKLSTFLSDIQAAMVKVAG